MFQEIVGGDRRSRHVVETEAQLKRVVDLGLLSSIAKAKLPFKKGDPEQAPATLVRKWIPGADEYSNYALTQSLKSLADFAEQLPRDEKEMNSRRHDKVPNSGVNREDIRDELGEFVTQLFKGKSSTVCVDRGSGSADCYASTLARKLENWLPTLKSRAGQLK
jgi:hypothetical protein